MIKDSKKISISLRSKTICTLITVLLCMALSGSLVFAQSGDSKSNYVALKGGIYTPTSNDLKGFSTGFNSEVAVGHYFNKYLASELSVGYFQSSISQAGSGSVGDTSFNGSAGMDLWAVPVTVAVKGLYPIQNFEPYVMGGVGVYFANAKFNYSGSFSSGGSTGTASGSSTANSTTFGGFLGAGANYNIDKNWYIGVEGKYLLTRPTFSFYGVDLKASMDGWQVTGNIGYRF